MGDKEWTPEREAAVLAAAEEGFDVSAFGPPVANPLRKAGRPSLSASGGISKTLNARIPAELHGKITALADEEGRSVSDLTRDALDALVADEHRPAARAEAPAARSSSELIDAVARRLGGRAVAADAIEAVLASIIAAVAQGDRVAIVGFGTFEKSPEGPDVRVRLDKKAAARSDGGGAGGGSAGRKGAKAAAGAQGARKSAARAAAAKAAAPPVAAKKAKARKAG